jgi:hypothetical protein
MKTAITIEDLRVIAAYWAGRLSGGDFVDRYDVLPNFETDIMVSILKNRGRIIVPLARLLRPQLHNYENPAYTHAFPGPDEQTFEQLKDICLHFQQLKDHDRVQFEA